MRQRQFDAADSDFAQSVAKNNSNSAAVYYLGLSAEKQSKLEVAAIHYRKSIEMNPETAKYLAALSRVLGKAGDKAGPDDFAEKARKLFPAESFAIEEP